ncbi:imidazolonepropionase-like amidohydrolase [Arcanobacterium wilhelmae]|uniref:Imidazolonepropionase-like amidohydrolase n=1 Tax=Arcanobacterium wilhelmae TaxID=1803177 RepID=A0ABT9NAK7_9ACTO|nr:amidohydrolase family protein [Arcanobacterium wilhelmae]MDP9800759.1 imidazolonepropionase-like amidohydrolase [Arcanobacterium wilhelmae]
MNFHLTGHLRGTTQTQAWVSSGRISTTPPSGSVAKIEGWIYPGLVDCHTHPGASYDPEPIPDAEVLRRCAAYLANGVTAIRDCGGKRDPRTVRGGPLPKLMHAGEHITQPKRYFQHMGSEVEPGQLVSEIERQAAVSDGWIKLIGDWIDRRRGRQADLEPIWDPAELADAVAAAHELGRKVTVHTFGTETIAPLLEAGVDGIEHGTGMTREHLQEARKMGVLITPTVCQIATFPQIASGAVKYPVYARRMIEMSRHQREHLELMVEEESLFLMGSDSTDDVATRTLPLELVTAVVGGMPADVVMAAASYAGRERIGLPNWQEGAPADFVVYDADPLTDITTVFRPLAVLLDGELVGGTGVGGGEFVGVRQ